jgi:phage terminase small subunit
MAGRPLTPKQQRFVQEYLLDLNATAAARRAGYSARTADRIGPKLVGKSCVAAAIAAGQAERAARVGAKADDVLRELMLVAYQRGHQVYRPDGSLKAPHEWDDATAATVAGVEVLEEFDGSGKNRQLVGYTRKLKRWDKVRALELLGRHLRLFTEKHEHSGPDGGPIAHECANLTDGERLARLRELLGRAQGRVDGRGAS